MHYNTARGDHGLLHDPFAGLVVPRPIGWISTLNGAGTVNLAPYSYFNIVAQRPHFVMFSSAHRKDSQRNAEEQGEFTVSLATYDLREAVNLSSAALGAEHSEPALLGLEMAPSMGVRPPRVAASPAALECRYHRTIDLPGAEGEPHFCSIVLGEVVSVFVADDVIVDGIVDIRRMRPIARLGYMDYAVIDEVFAMPRPAPADLLGHRPPA